MILFIDTFGLDNDIAFHLEENIYFFHNISNVNIVGNNIKYFHLNDFHIISKQNIEIVVIIGNFSMLNQIYSMFPNAHIIIKLAKEIPMGIPCNIPFTLVSPKNTNAKQIIYEKIGLLVNVEEIETLEEWKILFKKLRSTENLTMISSNKLNILLIKRSKLAEAPDELAKAINKYTPHHADIDCVPLKNYNVLHYNNIFIPTSHTKTIIQYHSEPSRVTFKNKFENFPKTELVLSQYHATLPEYSHCQIVQNVINFETDLYNLHFNENKLKIGYSPSITKNVNRYYNKGYDETKKILESLENVEIDIITGQSLEECIRRKSKCDIIIDECVKGSFHRSGLEGLALGKMTICWINDSVVEMLKENISKEIPFENIYINNLKEFLEKCQKMSRTEIHDIGKKNRKWMETHWHPKDIANKYIQIYKNL